MSTLEGFDFSLAVIHVSTMSVLHQFRTKYSHLSSISAKDFELASSRVATTTTALGLQGKKDRTYITLQLQTEEDHKNTILFCYSILSRKGDTYIWVPGRRKSVLHRERERESANILAILKEQHLTEHDGTKKSILLFYKTI